MSVQIPRDFRGVFNQLDDLEKSIRNKAIKKGQRAGAKILAAEIRRQAPERTGLIKVSIKVRAGKRRKNVTSMQVTIANENRLFYIGFIEFGTRKMPANAFIRRSVEAKRQEAWEATAEAIEVEIHNGHWARSRGIST